MNAKMMSVACAMVLAAGGASAQLASADQQDALWGATANGFAQPTFHVTTDGPEGDTVLRSIEFPGGWNYNKFIFAREVTGFAHEGDADDTRVVLGPNATGVAGLAAGGASGNWDRMDEGDAEAFEDALTQVMRNTNLNNFIDNNGSSPYFEFVLELEKPLKDNDPELDEVGEIIFFERGADTANSFLVMEALDTGGNVIGTPVLVHPDEPVSCTPAAHVGVYRSNLSYAGWSQEMGGVSVDLTRFGLSTVERIRVRRARVGHDGLTGDMVAGGRDLNPDFKLVFVQTYDISVPVWFLGD
ncbi:MAG: hypothetical protein AAGK04_02240 [Planctomycetota bacterium]